MQCLPKDAFVVDVVIDHLTRAPALVISRFLPAGTTLRGGAVVDFEVPDPGWHTVLLDNGASSHRLVTADGAAAFAQTEKLMRLLVPEAG